MVLQSSQPGHRRADAQACCGTGARIQENAGANTRLFGGQVIPPADVLSAKMMPPHEFQVRWQDSDKTWSFPPCVLSERVRRCCGLTSRLLHSASA